MCAVYLTGDDLIDRQNTVLTTLTRMEGLVLERLKDIDYTGSRAMTSGTAGAAMADTAAHVQRLEALLTLLDNVRQPVDVASLPPDHTAAPRPPLHSAEVAVSPANARP
jgi:hypothetical protein